MRNAGHHKVVAYSVVLLALVAGIFALSSDTTAQDDATIIYVDHQQAGEDGSSWDDAYADLQVALDAAEGRQGTVEVWVAEGIYYPTDDPNDRNASFELLDNVEIYGGFPSGGSDFDARDWGENGNQTVLSGDIGRDGELDGNNSYSVVYGDDIDDTAVLDGFTVTGGYANGSVGVESSRGGGLYLFNASPTLANLTVSGNQAMEQGGGLYLQDSYSTITNSVISGNESPGSSNSDLTTGFGGGLVISDGGPLITQTVIGDNQAVYGGGAYISNSAAIIVNSLISDNGPSEFGGGLYFSVGKPTITNTTISDNETWTAGGGVYLTDGAVAALTNSIFWGNTSLFEPNIGAQPSYDATIDLSASILQGGCSAVSSVPGTCNTVRDEDPQFVDADAGNYRVQSTSPAINQGDNDAYDSVFGDEDLDDNSRIFNGTIDIGSYEFQGEPFNPSKTVYVDEAAESGGDGSSWDNAFVDLQDGLYVAEYSTTELSDPVEVWVAAGTYYPTDDPEDREASFLIHDDVKVYGGFAGDESSRDARDWGEHETVLSGHIDEDAVLSGNSYTVVTVESASNGVVLDGFTINGGNGNEQFSPPGREFYGGGVYVANSDARLTNLEITGNAAGVGGGVHSASSTVTITNSSIAGNETTEPGAGVYSLSSEVTITNTTISGNTATESFLGGGGIYGDLGSTTEIYNSIVWGNLAFGNKDAIGLQSIVGSPTAEFHDSMADGNACDVDGVTCDTATMQDWEPDFENPNNGDYRLQESSMAIDAGITDAFRNVANELNRDLDANPRFDGDAIDLGAYEYQSSTGPGPADSITLQADNTTPTVDATVTITAKVLDSSQNPVEDGTELSFDVAGDGAGDAIWEPGADIATTQNGTATFTYSNTAAGQDTVTATVQVADSGAVTEDIQISWQPGDPASFALAVDESELTVSEQNKATVDSIEDEYGNTIAAGVDVTFTLTRTEGDTANWTSGNEQTVPVSGGEATFAFSTTVTGTDTLSAAITEIGTKSETVVWTPDAPDGIELRTSTDTPQAGSDVTVTASVKDQYGNDVEDDTHVSFAVSGDGAGDATWDDGTDSATTSAGEATFTYSNTTASIDTVTATVERDNAGGLTEDIQITWLPGPPQSIALEVDPATQTVGAAVTITSTVQDEHGNDVADGTDVTFSILRGGDPSDSAELTDPSGSWTVQTSDGHASLGYTNTLTGTDAITVVVGEESESLADAVTWNPGPPAAVKVTVAPTELTVGRPATTTAAVTDAFGNAVSDGTEVTFQIDGDGSPELVDPTHTWSAYTTDGRGAIQYTNTVTGTDTVSASVDGVPDENITDASVIWLPGEPNRIVLGADPDEQTVGEAVTLTARVTDEFDNHVADGTEVSFAIDRDDTASIIGGTGWTAETSDGNASLEYTNTSTGSDAVTARVDDIDDAVTVTWKPDDPDRLILSMSPEEATIGTLVAATAEVTDQYDNPVADGTAVWFAVDRDRWAVLGVNSDWTVPTADGQAVVYYTNLQPGRDTVTAQADDVSDTATIAWDALAHRRDTPSQDLPENPDEPDEPDDPDDPHGPSEEDPPPFPEYACVDGFSNAAFEQTWARTDRPVRDFGIDRTWMWGPCAFTEVLSESYADSPEGQRDVAYFDKARMELTDPQADPTDPWYVTNGLLVVELITGQRQLGDDAFADYGPAGVNVVGDPDDPDSPTYASLTELLDVPPQAVGTRLTRRLARDGTVTDDPAYVGHAVSVAHVDEVTSHGIAQPFWALMNRIGTVYEDGALVDDQLVQHPVYATGRPITEAYWTTVSVDGEEQDVLLQCFERRCLTYTPGNPEGFVVEAGNVGQHYYYWRYVLAPGE